VIRRDLHATCDNCWWKIVKAEPSKTKDRHHFFYYQKHPDCCFCGSPAHGLWLRKPRAQAPCHGMTGYHADGENVVDMQEMRVKYMDDPEVQALLRIAAGLQEELEATTKQGR
jgi:hypothetical protein